MTSLTAVEENFAMRSKWMVITLLSAALSATVPGNAQVAAPKAANSTKTSPTKAVTAPPTDAEIGDAKNKGLVWVNSSTRVYHKDGAFFGKTKRGKFMTEDEATKAGNKAAKEPVAKKAKTDPKK
jgi:hypothetical protein